MWRHCNVTTKWHKVPPNLRRVGTVVSNLLLAYSEYTLTSPLQWRHNERDDVSNHQPHDCLLDLLFRRRSKKTSKLRVTDLCAGNSPCPMNSQHKGRVTRKCFHLMTSSCLDMLLTVCLINYGHFLAVYPCGYVTNAFRIYMTYLTIFRHGPTWRLNNTCLKYRGRQISQ